MKKPLPDYECCVNPYDVRAVPTATIQAILVDTEVGIDTLGGGRPGPPPRYHSLMEKNAASLATFETIRRKLEAILEADHAYG